MPLGLISGLKNYWSTRATRAKGPQIVKQWNLTPSELDGKKGRLIFDKLRKGENRDIPIGFKPQMGKAFFFNNVDEALEAKRQFGDFKDRREAEKEQRRLDRNAPANVKLQKLQERAGLLSNQPVEQQELPPAGEELDKQEVAQDKIDVEAPKAQKTLDSSIPPEDTPPLEINDVFEEPPPTAPEEPIQQTGGETEPVKVTSETETLAQIEKMKKAGVYQAPPETAVLKVTGAGVHTSADGTRVNVNRMPREDNDGGGGPALFSFRINGDGSVEAGNAYWWNQFNQDWDERNYDFQLFNVNNGFYNIKLSIDTTTGQGTWGPITKSSNNKVQDSTALTRYWCIGKYENGVAQNFITHDIYETRAS